MVWINFLLLNEPEKAKKPTNYPPITIAIPAYNEEKNIARTIKSVLNLSYPKEKLQILIINDGSTDNTKKIVKDLIKNHSNARLINKTNQGKAAALNTALTVASGKLFGCVDSDSTVDKNALKHIIPHFSNKKTAAVISALRVDKPKNLFEKIQRLEYIIAILSRKLRASINTLAMTPGVLSIYRTAPLKKLGSFDLGNPTEDFEIALRLKYHGYSVELEPRALTYTKVPSTFKSFWRQRIRWYRGFIFNHLKYKDMFFSKKHGLMGYFQLPLNIIGILLLLVGISVISYAIIDRLSEFIIRLATIKGYLLNHLFYIPSFKEFILAHNTKIMLPIYISSIAGLFLFYVAHKQTKEKIKFPFTIFTYFVLYPYLVTTEWISAITQELMKFKRRW